MDEIKDRLSLALKIKDKSAKDLSDLTSIPKSSISQYMSGYAKPKSDRIHSIAKALHINEAWLLGYDVPMERKEDERIYRSANLDFIRIPLYPPICCGNGGFADDDIIEYVPVPSKGMSDPSNYFCQVAQGDSMKDAGIDNGDLLVFEKTSAVHSGMIGAFCIDENEAVCKKYTEVNGMILLQPMNSNYDPIPVDPLNEHFRCVGKLKKSIKDFNE